MSVGGNDPRSFLAPSAPWIVEALGQNASLPVVPHYIDGILVTLPNFGDEKGVADTLKLADLNVPVLVQAYPDDLDQLSVERRRDAFCGKISCSAFASRNRGSSSRA